MDLGTSRATKLLVTDAGVNRTSTLQSTFAKVELRPRPNPLFVGPSMNSLPGLASPTLKQNETWVEIVTPAKPYAAAAATKNQEQSMPVLRASFSDQKPGLVTQKRGLFEEIRGFKLKGEATRTIAEGSELQQDNMMSPGLKMMQRRIYQNGFESLTPTKQLKISRRTVLNQEMLPALSENKPREESPATRGSKAKLMRLGSFSDDGTRAVGGHSDERANAELKAVNVLGSKSIFIPEPNSAVLSGKRKPIKALRVN